MPIIHLVQPSSKGKIKYITLNLEGSTVSRVWGLIGCKEQTTSHNYKSINEGKANELAPEQAAKADWDRLIADRIKEGYKPVDSLENAGGVAKLDTFNFDNPPTSFSPAKPIKEIANEKLARMLAKKQILPTLKENGLRHFIFVGTNRQVTIYTRRMDDHTRKYPHIVEAVKNLMIPSCTVLDCEFVVKTKTKIGHTLAFNLMQGISKSDTSSGKVKEDLTRTMALQEETPVRALVFDVLFLNKEPVWEKIYQQRWGLIQTVVDGKILCPPTVLRDLTTVEAIDAWIQENKGTYEGLVLWDLSCPSEVVFTGKPKRKGCYKRKPISETDVIAVGYEEGTGENQGKIGAFLISQIDPSTGKMVDLGKCGAGLVDSDRDPSKWTFPCVIMIEYANRFPGTSRFQFPCFIKLHESKGIEECILDITED